MGQISGVNANLITSIAGVAVANISYVGPVSAATLGLGGGGGPDRVFATDAWATALEACINGEKAIDKNGPMTLYQQGDFFYYDSEFANSFNGDGSWWWCQTNNFSYQINTEGGIMTSQNCSSGGSKIFTTIYYGNGEETCYNGPGAISKGNTQTLYPSGEFFYTDSGLTTPFNGLNVWWYNGTDNISYQINTEGGTMTSQNCGAEGKVFTNSTEWGEPAKACNDGPIYIGNGGETIVLYYKQEDNRMYTNSSFTEVFFGNNFYYWNQTDNQWWIINTEGYVALTGSCG